MFKCDTSSEIHTFRTAALTISTQPNLCVCRVMICRRNPLLKIASEILHASSIRIIVAIVVWVCVCGGVFVCLSLCVCVGTFPHWIANKYSCRWKNSDTRTEDLLNMKNRFPRNEFFNYIHVGMKYYILDLVFIHIQQKLNKLLKAWSWVLYITFSSKCYQFRFGFMPLTWLVILYCSYGMTFDLTATVREFPCG